MRPQSFDLTAADRSETAREQRLAMSAAEHFENWIAFEIDSTAAIAEA